MKTIDRGRGRGTTPPRSACVAESQNRQAGRGAERTLEGTAIEHCSVDVSDIFYFFFCSGEGEGGSPRRREGGGEKIFTENPRRGVSRAGLGRGGRGSGRVSARNLGGGGGLNIFFRARNSHQDCRAQIADVNVLTGGRDLIERKCLGLCLCSQVSEYRKTQLLGAQCNKTKSENCLICLHF